MEHFLENLNTANKLSIVIFPLNFSQNVIFITGFGIVQTLLAWNNILFNQEFKAFLNGQLNIFRHNYSFCLITKQFRFNIIQILKNIHTVFGQSNSRINWIVHYFQKDTVLHEQLCLFKAENDGFGIGYFFLVHLQVFYDQLKVLDLSNYLTFAKDGLFQIFYMSNITVCFFEIKFNQLDHILAVHFRMWSWIQQILPKVFLSHFLLILWCIVKIHFNNILQIQIKNLIPSWKTIHLRS